MELFAKNLFKVLKNILGAILIFLGIIGFIIPFIQGWLFIAAGLFVMNPALLKKGKEKFKEWREKRRAKTNVIDAEVIE